MIGKVVLIAGVGVVGLGAIGDLAVRSRVEAKIAERAEAAAGGEAKASADIDSFPFVLRLLTSGKAGDVSVHVEDVATSALHLASVDLDLEGVELDRDKLFSERRGEINDIETGTITVGIDADALSKALGGFGVRIRDGAVEVEVAGRRVKGQVSVAAAGRVRVQVPNGPSATVGIPRTDLVACAADAVTVEDDEVRVSCTIREVPPALLRAAQAG